MKIEILNQQKIRKVNRKEISRSINKIISLLCLPDLRLSLVLCDNRFITGLNKKYFARSMPTDVISFSLSDGPGDNDLGEVVVSVQEAVRVAKDLGHSWQQELMLYIIHGILHLVGYNDETCIQRRLMESKQEAILRELFK